METNELADLIYKALFNHFHIKTIIYDLWEDSFKFDLADENGKINLWKVNYTIDEKGLNINWNKAEIVRHNFNREVGEAGISMDGN